MQLLAFGFPGYLEIAVVVLVGLLIFGRRLPEIGRSVGKTIVEFKKGIREVKDDVHTAATSDPPVANRLQPPPASTDAQPGNATEAAGAPTSPTGDSAAATPSPAGEKAPSDQT